MIKSNSRIEWIDIAKGMSIILVVHGNCGLSVFHVLANWFASFMMPFFFFISGILFNPFKYDGLVVHTKKKWKGLIRPFFIFSFIVFLVFLLFDEEGLKERMGMFPILGWGGYAL